MNLKINLIKELLSFCSQPAIAAQKQGMDEMAKLVELKLKDIGALVQVVKVKNSNKFLLADIKASSTPEAKKTVLIYNHYDVQPIGDAKEWASNPFEPYIKKGKVYARGVADNRGDLLSRIQVVRLMLENKNLPINIKWLIEGEEEIGSPHLKQLQEKYGDFWKDCDVCIWEDGRVDPHGRPIVALGMKGILYVELSSQFNKSDLHSKLASVVDSPVWTMVSALQTLRSPSGEVLLDDFYKDAVEPNKFENEIIKKSLVDPHKMAGASVEKYLVNPNSKKDFLTAAYFKGSCNIAGIWGGFTEDGGVKTIIPNKVIAKVDFRLVHNQDPDKIFKKLRDHLDARGFKDIQTKLLAKLLPTKTAADNKFVQASIKVLKSIYKKDPVIDITSLGGGPTYYVAAIYKIPIVEIGVGYPSANMHGANENIKIVHYFKAMAAFEKYLIKLADI